MPNEIQTKFLAKSTFTLTLAALANGTARQSTLLNNSSNYPAALVYIRIRSGAVAPTANTVYEVYLIRGSDPTTPTYRTDNAGAVDAAITIENAQLLGTLVVTATANKDFYAEFDTAALGVLGPEWGIAVRNSSGQALNATEANHVKEFRYYVAEVQ